MVNVPRNNRPCRWRTKPKAGGVPNPYSPNNPSQLLPPPPPPGPQHQHILNIDEKDEPLPLPPPPGYEEWMVSIKAKLDQACRDDVASTWSKLCIYEVPHYLKVGDERSFEPQIASIGPYHHGKKQLRNMDRHKWRSLMQMLKRKGHEVKIYLNDLKGIEDRVRACYEGPITLESDKFVEMMLLDGCFILELFKGAKEGFETLGYPGNDPIFAMSGLMHTIQRDLIMLDNQLPLFVLDLLLGIHLGQPEQIGLVSELALGFFDPLTPTDKPGTDEPSTKSLHCLEVFCRSRLESSLDYATTFDLSLDHGSSLHCLEVFYKGLLGSGPRQPLQSHPVADLRQQLQVINCVTDLKKAGIKFQRYITDRFWDVKFEDGILKIPRLLIHDGTKSLFLNLIAFEQSRHGCSSHITPHMQYSWIT